MGNGNGVSYLLSKTVFPGAVFALKVGKFDFQNMSIIEYEEIYGTCASKI